MNKPKPPNIKQITNHLLKDWIALLNQGTNAK